MKQFYAVTFFLISSVVLSQMHYNYNSGGAANTFPFGILPATGKTIQTLYLSGDFNNPSPVPKGLITKLYVRAASNGNATYNSIKIRMGLTDTNNFSGSGWYTGPLTTVFNQTNVNLIATSGNFVSITLDNPFFYDPTKSLVVEIEQCGYSGTGFNVFTTTTSGQKRNTSTTASVPCPHPWLNTGAFMTHTGIDITPITNPFSLCRNSINKPILDFTAIRDTISVTIGSNKVVTDLVVRIDTVLHSWDSDLSFYITKGSASTKFINRVGGSGDNFIGTNIKDSAALCQIGSTGCNTAPFTGTYRPSVGGSFAGFINQPVNGNWILTITDTVGGDTGQLRAWCLVIRWQDITSGQSGTTELPSYYELKQNYPNPFNPSTTIKFSIPKGENVKLTVFDMLGQEVKVLVNEFRSAGVYEINFDASLFSSGVYFYKIETEGFTDTKKMLLVK